MAAQEPNTLLHARQKNNIQLLKNNPKVVQGSVIVCPYPEGLQSVKEGDCVAYLTGPKLGVSYLHHGIVVKHEGELKVVHVTFQDQPVSCLPIVYFFAVMVEDKAMLNTHDGKLSFIKYKHETANLKDGETPQSRALQALKTSAPFTRYTVANVTDILDPLLKVVCGKERFDSLFSIRSSASCCDAFIYWCHTTEAWSYQADYGLKVIVLVCMVVGPIVSLAIDWVKSWKDRRRARLGSGESRCIIS